ncbi:CD209 antigen-like protein E [Salvelinus fontinalis]|uniref:CD209 antigen-like protein E n=1 Tax=Salvelinus fontinalis TaxID=8038 RepID=UPI00248570A6|nr:CD209 antigen-like protein E [Salvelinus fontinalis]
MSWKKDGVGDQHSVWKRRFLATAVCLGLLCVLLLAGIIGLLLYQRNLLNNLTAERDQLQTSYNTLTAKQDQLQTNYSSLTKERDQLQTSYNTLTAERDQLQTSYNTLTAKQDQLQTNYSSLTKERDQLLKIDKYVKCPQDWIRSSCSCYYISPDEKTWDDSRKDCQARGANLVIIDSREEQALIKAFNKKAWLGLTDREVEGTWRWVDGTPLTTSYWKKGEPNDLQGEDCALVDNTQKDPVVAWNDVPCNHKNGLICERQVCLVYQ